MKTTTRTYLFLCGCIGSRLMLAWLAKNASPQQLKYLGFLALLPAFGFILLYMSDSRQAAPEAGGSTWWNAIRPIHGVLYLLFAIYAIKSSQYAWTILAGDAMLGLLFWYMKYYMHYSLK